MLSFCIKKLFYSEGNTTKENLGGKTRTNNNIQSAKEENTNEKEIFYDVTTRLLQGLLIELAKVLLEKI